MIVTPLPELKLEQVNPISRPEGLHVSDIIKSILVELDPKVYGQPMNMEKIAVGLSFEELLGQMFRPGSPYAFRPEPVRLDGVWCSPDSIEPTGPLLEEFKLTWYSSSKQVPFDPVYWSWLVQIKAYCKAFGMQNARLVVLHINGNYKPPKPLPPQSYGLTFDQHEIDLNWHMLLQHAYAKGLL
jgi:hypothetical protein